MIKTLNNKQYALEDRTLTFAKRVRIFIGQLPKNVANLEDSKQLVRSSGSIGANYIEGNESLSKKDFLTRIKIARKEAIESIFWLELINSGENSSLEEEQQFLLNEAKQLMMILGAIFRKSVA